MRLKAWCTIANATSEPECGVHGVTLQVANGGGFEALALDAAGRVLSRSYAQRVAAHEAGHFLLAYLVGLLPKSYTLSSLDALRRCAI